MKKDQERSSRWAVARAKTRLAALVASAREAPQTIERRGEPVAVVLGVDAYEDLARRAEEGSPHARWKRFLAASARLRAEGGADLEIPRRRPRASPFPPRRV